MDRFYDALNSLSDMDSGWWPFLFMRPSQDERMGTRRVALIAVLYGLFAGMFANVALALSGEGDRVNFFLFPILTTLGFFVFFNATFALSWNARAERLSIVPPRVG